MLVPRPHALLPTAVAAVFVLSAAALGCSPSPPADEAMETEEVAPEEVAPPPDTDALPLRAHAYDCDDGTALLAEFKAEEVALTLPDRNLALPHVPSGSGARYAAGDAVFWTHDDEALLGFAGDEGPTVSCVENRRRSVIESARLDGARLWAAGNEPGWTLRVYPDRILLISDYGATRIQAPTTDPRRAGGATVYSTTSNDHDLRVTVRDRACADDMSGEEFAVTVELTVDGRTLRGCGEHLG